MTMTHSRRSLNFRLLFATFMFLTLLTSLFAFTGSAGAAAPVDSGRGCWEQQIFWPPTLTSTPQYLLNGGEDTILVSRVVDQPSNIIRIVLKSDTYYDWWKGIDVFYGANIIAQTFTEGKIHSNSIIFSFDSKYFRSYVFRLNKAKFFGVHTGMYCLTIDNWFGSNFQWGGSTITFNWTHD